MILRRFMQHMKEQNWFAVGLDIIVVIVGIFAALQADAWYTYHQDRVEEKQLISLLSEELNETVARLEENNQSFTSARDRARQFLDALKSNNQELASENKSGLITVTRIPKAQINSPTYDDIAENGKIDLILDNEIRVSLWNVRRAVQSVNSVNNQVNPQMSDIVSDIREAVYFDFTSFGTIDYDFEQLKENKKFINALAYSIYLNNVVFIYNERLIEQLKQLNKKL